jgi:hypothetical protein
MNKVRGRLSNAALNAGRLPAQEHRPQLLRLLMRAVDQFLSDGCDANFA